MNSTFSNINLASINFINNKNDMQFDFYTSTSEYRSIGFLVCENIISLKMDSGFELFENREFPHFICDITLTKLESLSDVSKELELLSFSFSGVAEYEDFYLVKFEGGSFDIKLLCKKVEYYDDGLCDD